MVFINSDKLSGRCNSPTASLMVVVVSGYSSHIPLLSLLCPTCRLTSLLARSCTQPLKKHLKSNGRGGNGPWFWKAFPDNWAILIFNVFPWVYNILVHGSLFYVALMFFLWWRWYKYKEISLSLFLFLFFFGFILFCFIFNKIKGLAGEGQPRN